MAYRAAIVGCGSIGHAHMEGYQLVDGVDVVAIVDPVPEARAHYLEQYPDLSLQEYATVDQMLADAKPDIVSVCTWHLLHPAPTIAAAQAGVKAVICEKPMAIGMGAANSMVEACDVSGTKLVISHLRRFTPGWEKGRQLVADGVIGTPQFVTNKVREGLTNWGTHTIDGSRFVLGDPRAEWVMGAVERRTDRFERDTAIEDACMGLIHFEGGVQLFIQSDMMAEGATAGGFQIRGTEGFMEISETTIRLLNDDGWQDVEIDGRKRRVEMPWPQPQFVPPYGGVYSLKDVMDCLAGELDEPKNSGRRVAVALEVEIALKQSSAQKGARVNLPLEARSLGLNYDWFR